MDDTRILLNAVLRWNALAVRRRALASCTHGTAAVRWPSVADAPRKLLAILLVPREDQVDVARRAEDHGAAVVDVRGYEI